MITSKEIKEIKESNYYFIYDKNLPDKNTEFFWYIFKESINNTITPTEKKNETKF
jgi:hypothetical protein